MGVKQVRVRVGVTRKTNVQYEMIRLDEELIIDLEEGETARDLTVFARDYLKKMIDKDVKELLKK